MCVCVGVGYGWIHDKLGLCVLGLCHIVSRQGVCMSACVCRYCGNNADVCVRVRCRQEMRQLNSDLEEEKRSRISLQVRAPAEPPWVHVDMGPHGETGAPLCCCTHNPSSRGSIQRAWGSLSIWWIYGLTFKKLTFVNVHSTPICVLIPWTRLNVVPPQFKWEELCRMNWNL